MGEAISVKDVSMTYHSGSETTKALDSVSISVKEGEIFGLLGPNGAGKTTLISILSGILSPDHGEAKVFGMDCSRETKKVQRRINVVSGFTGVVRSLSCREALTYYGLLYNVRNIPQKVDEVLKMTGLEKSRNAEADDLSSGMKQRFLIAKGLLNDPDLLIMDEPTVGLDVESAIGIRKMVKNLRSEGRTILLTTHNMFEAEELCDRIAFINSGRIIATGTPVELKSRIVSKRVIEIHCTREDCVVGSLSPLVGVKAVIKSPNLVHVTVDSYKKMKGVLKALSGCDSDVFSVNELEPTLEEAYLQIINNKPREGLKGGSGGRKRPQESKERESDD
jgi:ABC-2 type transport system ATP-binding protein